MIAMKEAEEHPTSISAEQWHKLHLEKIEQKKAFATLSTNSKVVEIKDAGHAIHIEDPDAVVRAIQEVLNAALHHARLAQSAAFPQYYRRTRSSDVDDNVLGLESSGNGRMFAQ